MASVLYLDVTTAAAETAGKILAQRRTQAGKPVMVQVGTGGGMTASVNVLADGRVHMSLPGLGADAVLSRGEADRILGYVAHECLHVLHTDWPAWGRAVRCGPRVQRWVNCLEDVRIEAKEIKAGHYPALRGLLASVADHMHYRDSVRAATYVIGAKLADAPYCYVISGRLANGYPIPSASGLTGAMSPEVQGLVAYALTEGRLCRSTSDCLTLALELVRREKAMISPPPPVPPVKAEPEAGETEAGEAEAGEAEAGETEAGEAGEAGESEAGEGEAGEAGESEAGEGDAGESEAGEAGEAGTDTGEAGGQGHGDGQGAENDPGLDGTASLDDIVARVVEQTGERPVPGAHGLHGYHNVTDTSMTKGKSGAAESRNVAAGLDAALPGRAILAGQIARLLVAPERTWVTHRETSGRLDRRALVRVGTGALDVFSQRHEQAGTDTALLILVDGSGSMRGSRWQMAMVTAWHLACAAEQAGARVGVTVFMTTDQKMAGSNRPGAKLVPLLGMGEPVRANAARLGVMQPNAYTPLSPAILGGAQALLEVQATRRIQMVLTDGDCDHGNACVTQACNIAATWGVETVGIGMNAPTVIDAFPSDWSVNVLDMDQLARTGLGVLCDMLEDNAA